MSNKKSRVERRADVKARKQQQKESERAFKNRHKPKKPSLPKGPGSSVRSRAAHRNAETRIAAEKAAEAAKKRQDEIAAKKAAAQTTPWAKERIADGMIAHDYVEETGTIVDQVSKADMNGVEDAALDLVGMIDARRPAAYMPGEIKQLDESVAQMHACERCGSGDEHMHADQPYQTPSGRWAMKTYMYDHTAMALVPAKRIESKSENNIVAKYAEIEDHSLDGE